MKSKVAKKQPDVLIAIGTGQVMFGKEGKVHPVKYAML
jgi:hypothetical protein